MKKLTKNIITSISDSDIILPQKKLTNKVSIYQNYYNHSIRRTLIINCQLSLIQFKKNRIDFYSKLFSEYLNFYILDRKMKYWWL